jgi:hypothetical protein
MVDCGTKPIPVRGPKVGFSWAKLHVAAKAVNARITRIFFILIVVLK